MFPERFGSLADAQDFMDRFVQAYNEQHRHSGIGFHTPADVYFGMTGHVEDQRLAALQKAGTRIPNGSISVGVPKKLQMPSAAWINEPVKLEDGEEL